MSSPTMVKRWLPGSDGRAGGPQEVGVSAHVDVTRGHDSVVGCEMLTPVITVRRQDVTDLFETLLIQRLQDQGRPVTRQSFVSTGKNPGLQTLNVDLDDVRPATTQHLIDGGELDRRTCPLVIDP